MYSWKYQLIFRTEAWSKVVCEGVWWAGAAFFAYGQTKLDLIKAGETNHLQRLRHRPSSSWSKLGPPGMAVPSWNQRCSTIGQLLQGEWAFAGPAPDCNYANCAYAAYGDNADGVYASDCNEPYGINAAYGDETDRVCYSQGNDA